MRILLVDDEGELVYTLAERLRIRGHEVDAFIEGRKALKELTNTDYDVAVIDMKMPDVNGMAMLMFIRRDHPYLPVILLTGHGSTEDGKKGMKEGAFAYLIKPINIDDLIDNMTKAVGTRDGK